MALETLHFSKGSDFEILTGVQKDAVRFSDLLEGFTEPRGAVLLMVMLYYSERIQIKMSKEQKNMEQSLEETRHMIQCLLQWSHIDNA